MKCDGCKLERDAGTTFRPDGFGDAFALCPVCVRAIEARERARAEKAEQERDELSDCEDSQNENACGQCRACLRIRGDSFHARWMEERAEARAALAIMAHAYDHDCRPPDGVLQVAREAAAAGRIEAGEAEALANARIMVAGLDLLEALQAYLREHDGFRERVLEPVPCDCELCVAARAAVSRAREEER